MPRLHRPSPLWSLAFASLSAVAGFVPLPLPFAAAAGAALGLPHAQAIAHWHGLVLGTFQASAQVPAACLAGLLLGSRLGATSQLFYLGLGLFVLPVFGAGGGAGYVAQDTFGYLLGLLPAAYLAGGLRGGVRRTGWGLSAALFALDLCGAGYETWRAPDGFDLGAFAGALHLDLQALPGQLALMAAIALVYGTAYRLLRPFRPVRRLPVAPAPAPRVARARPARA